MTTETPIDALGWAATIHRLHRETAGHVIAGHLTMNADDPVALSNWVLIKEEFLILTSRARRVNIPRASLPA